MEPRVLPVNEHIQLLLTGEAHDHPCDRCEPSELETELPPWFDKVKYKRGQQMMQYNLFSQFLLMFCGLISVLAVPNILNVLKNSQRSSTVVTAYRRYLSTMKHIVSWYSEDLTPGTKAWKSLSTVRARHLRSSKMSEKSGNCHISQLDLVLTQFGFFGFGILRPRFLGIDFRSAADEEGYIHFWQTIGYMMGVEDKYNICRPSVSETREVCVAVCDDIYKPLLLNPPEYFYYMVTTLIEGLWYFSPTMTKRVILYFTYRLVGIQGFNYTEVERKQASLEEAKEKKLRTLFDMSQILTNNNITNGSAVTPRTDLNGDTFYGKMLWIEKVRLYFMISVSGTLMYTTLGRLYFNGQINLSLFLVEYFPFLCFSKFGWKNSFVDMFKEDIKAPATPKTNQEILATEYY